jgi:hypothetical protein
LGKQEKHVDNDYNQFPFFKIIGDGTFVRDKINKVFDDNIGNIVKLILGLGFDYSDESLEPGIMECIQHVITNLEEINPTMDEIEHLIYYIRVMCEAKTTCIEDDDGRFSAE